VPFPRQHEIEGPLLEVLLELGGQAKPRDVYPLVAKRFPQLTPEEQEERLENYPSTRKWSNLVQWVRQRLVDSGQIDGSVRGVWQITQAGRNRLAAPPAPAATTSSSLAQPPTASNRDLMLANVEEVKGGLLAALKELTPAEVSDRPVAGHGAGGLTRRDRGGVSRGLRA
jgi:restriction system protein